MNRSTADLIVALIAMPVLLAGFGCAGAEVLHPPFPGVEVLERAVGETTLFSVQNPQLSEMTVGLDFTLDNLTPSVRLPIEWVVPPKSTTPTLVVLRPKDPAKSWQYTYRNDFCWGAPTAQHDTNQLYLLPFAPGGSFRVVQGQDGAFSHKGDDRFAIDFGLPEGTPVFAARGGLVVLVRDGFDMGGPDSSLKLKVNEVFVRHSDGTLGEYVHLQKDGMKVKVGDTITAGQFIAHSGNTGYTQGPHLHFMVFRAKNSKDRESFPIHFVTKEGSGLTLKQGRRYTAVGFGDRLGRDSGTVGGL
jgi:murein DD-endopeptidase MepM/ murein hydrolase activator NlpD